MALSWFIRGFTLVYSCLFMVYQGLLWQSLYFKAFHSIFSNLIFDGIYLNNYFDFHICLSLQLNPLNTLESFRAA